MAGGSGSLPGCIVGDVRDTSKSCGYTNYTTRNRDSKLALNDVTVTLSGNGQTQTVNTGSKCNGVYAFFVPAGTYTITVKKTGYKTRTKTVTVTNSVATQWNVDMVAGTDTGISVDAPNIGYGETPVGNTSAKTLKVTGSSLSSAITVTNSDNTNFSVTPSSLGTTGGKCRRLSLVPGWEDPLEEEMATHSSILDWGIPWTEEPGRLQSIGSQKSQIQFSN